MYRCGPVDRLGKLRGEILQSHVAEQAAGRRVLAGRARLLLARLHDVRPLPRDRSEIERPLLGELPVYGHQAARDAAWLDHLSGTG